MTTFDNIIIGAGPAGYELAALLSEKGESVCIVERDTPGGTCLNRGCIPTKCLVATSGAAAEIKESSALGVTVGDVNIDFPVAVARMRSVVSQLVDGVKATLAGCTYVAGEAEVTGNTTVAVNGQSYRASRRLVIASGSAPASLPIPGSELCVSSDQLLSIDSLPASVAIIGGGVIGIEFASILHDLGVKVSVVEYAKEILPPFDSETAKRLRTTLGRRGIDITVGARVTAVEKTAEGLKLVYEGKKGPASVEAEMVLMSVGRRPVLPAGIEKAGIKISPRGFIEVEPGTLKAAEGVYAIGDVNGLSMLAHSAYAQARAVAAEDPTLYYCRVVPAIVFSRPEVAQVGATPASLDAEGIPFKAVKHLFASNGKACAAGHPEGFLKMLTDEEDRLLGVSVIGAHAADLIAEATILVQNGCKASEIAEKYIHAHPTLSELFC